MHGMPGRVEAMLVGGLKALPLAAVVGAISARDALAYAGIASMLSSIVVVGALWSTVKLWRERAESRKDQVDQMTAEAIRRDADLDDVRHELGKVQDELAARPDIRTTVETMQREHLQILVSVGETATAVRAASEAAKAAAEAAHTDHTALVEAVDRNTEAVTAFGREIPWQALTARGT